MKNDLYSEYCRLDYIFNTHKDYSYEYLVNFSQTKDLPIHRWYYYVEGYSPELINKVIEYLQLNNNSIIFDPFTGAGTTLLASKNHNLPSLGFEVNPFSAFMAKVKTRNYSKTDIEKVKKFQIPAKNFIESAYDKYELRIIRDLFDEEKLSCIETLKSEINKVDDLKVRDLLYLGLLSILPDISNYRKGGNGLKRKKAIKDLNPFEKFKDALEMIAEDITYHNNNKPEPVVINDSCLNLLNYDLPQINASIFSPPYANCFDPFEVYKIELWVGEFVKSYEELRNKRRTALSSNLNTNIYKVESYEHRTLLLNNILDYLNSQELWDKKIPKMLDSYFHDMLLLLKKIYQLTISSGYCVIVVGNSAYGQLAIPTDILLGQMGEKAGFSVQEIIEARKNETSSQQHKKLGKHVNFIRESIIILKK